MRLPRLRERRLEADEMRAGGRTRAMEWTVDWMGGDREEE